MLALGLLYSGYGLARGLVSLATIEFGFGILITSANSASLTIWQRKVPEELSGRVLSAMWTISEITTPVSFLLAGPIGDSLVPYVLRHAATAAPWIGGTWGTGGRPSKPGLGRKGGGAQATYRPSMGQDALCPPSLDVRTEVRGGAQATYRPSMGQDALCPPSLDVRTEVSAVPREGRQVLAHGMKAVLTRDDLQGIEHVLPRDLHLVLNLKPVADANDIFLSEGFAQKGLGMAEGRLTPEDHAMGELVPANHAVPCRELGIGSRNGVSAAREGVRRLHIAQVRAKMPFVHRHWTGGPR